MSWYEDSELEMLRSFTERWASGALRGAERVREARQRAKTASRNYERLEDWSPTEEEVKETFDAVWVEEHLFVVAVAQFYNWVTRLVDEGSTVRSPSDIPSLTELRNTLEHLNEASLEENYARPDPYAQKKNWSLSKLPAGELFLGTHWGGATLTAFGMLDVDTVERECRQVMSDIFDERVAPHVDSYIQMLIDERRGK
ncbi:MAG: hypothetical protein JWP14_2669 [Frankiales bacterium]|nr:hypothetical protein [Frankiales bacterium]